MEKYCDLHCHSNCSDGTCTPEELVDLACRAGLSALAMTDHNTLAGVPAFLGSARGRIEACAGCEFTTEDQGQELHLLGLFSDTAGLEEIQEALDGQLRRKEESNRLTILRLAEAGYDLSYEEFLNYAGQGVKNRVHIARYLMTKGIVSDVKEAFDGLLSKDGKFYQESKKLDFCQTISLIAKAGGVSVWAHPLFHVNQEACQAILRKAKPFGLDGVEVYYSTYSPEDTAFMLEMSRQFNLLPSGGSDFHGENKPDIRIGVGRGNLQIPYEFYEGIKARMKNRRI